MKIHKNILFLSSVLINTVLLSQDGNTSALSEYQKTLLERGKEPVQFVLDALNEHDLILFDDANHSTKEPFEFYQKLIVNTDFQNKVRYIFFEVFSISQQPSIDSYLASDPEDRTLLYPAFQNDFSGTGWRYETYFDLLHAVYIVNRNLPSEKKFKVAGVSGPTYWNEIKTPRDLELFRQSLVSFDYTMYSLMLGKLSYFNSGIKGIFISNTRHVYKGIKNSEGKLYWNCGTFFSQWNPAKTYSVRFHNADLSFEEMKTDPNAHKTTEGLENIKYEWRKMAGGIWDSAFGEKPVGFDINRTPFGSEKYVGNHMLDALEGQTMQDAYDGIIFLAPLGKMHQSAVVDEINTPAFKKELERRLKILYTPEELKEELHNSNALNIQDYIEKQFRYEPEKLLAAAQSALGNKP